MSARLHTSKDRAREQDKTSVQVFGAGENVQCTIEWSLGNRPNELKLPVRRVARSRINLFVVLQTD